MHIHSLIIHALCRGATHEPIHHIAKAHNFMFVVAVWLFGCVRACARRLQMAKIVMHIKLSDSTDVRVNCPCAMCVCVLCSPTTCPFFFVSRVFAMMLRLYVFCMNDFLFIAIYFRKHKYVSCMSATVHAGQMKLPGVCDMCTFMGRQCGEMGEAKKTDRCLKYSAHLYMNALSHICTFAHPPSIDGKSSNESHI